MEFYKKQLKSIFLWASIIATAQLVPSLISNEWFSWQFYVFGSLIMGSCVALVLSVIHYYRLKRLKIGINDLTKEDLLTSQTTMINTSYSREESIKKVENFFNKKSIHVSDNMIVIKTSNWYGWNKTIVEFLSNGKKNLQLKVSSKPILPTTIFDFSENLKTIKNLERALGDSLVNE
ncbi:MAG: hypothetical protein ABJF11_12800 [Reichenbachiella sp.]|uniref:hypothetical protein n=1 Tax=Reichenbachiella sp. TaxID=2184521 RepID=UPI003264BB76